MIDNNSTQPVGVHPQVNLVSLSELTSVVKALNAGNITKEDIKELRDSMDKTVDKMEGAFKDAIDRLPCRDNNLRLTTAERELDKLGVAFKIKSSVWGLLGGLIPALVAVLWALAKA